MIQFDTEFMKKLEYLSLVSRRIFRGRLLAQRRTRQLGGGVEFADHREYFSGDDLRQLDWNIFARLGERFVKRFEEEQDLHVYFLLDCSKSMLGEDGSKNRNSKFDYAREITAALAYIALSDYDRVSVVAFSDRIHKIFPLTRGKGQIVNLLRFLENCEATGGTTDLTKVVGEFVPQTKRSGLAMIVSDMFDRKGFRKAMDLLRYRGFEPGIIQVHNTHEAEPKLRGDFRMTDAESGEIRNVTVDESVLRRYREKFTGFLDEIKKFCCGNGLSCTISRTSVPFDELVLRMMREAGGVA